MFWKKMKTLLSNKPSWRQYEKMITCTISPWNLKSQLWADQTWDFDSCRPLHKICKSKKSLAYSRNTFYFLNGSFSKWIQAWSCLMTWSHNSAYLKEPPCPSHPPLTIHIYIYTQKAKLVKREIIWEWLQKKSGLMSVLTSYHVTNSGQWLMANRDENVRQWWVYSVTSLAYFSTLQQPVGQGTPEPKEISSFLMGLDVAYEALF